jgi:hypothetical protein
VTTAVAGLVAFLLGLLSGATLVLGEFLTLPDPVLLAALGGLLVTVLTTGACAFADARRTGRGFGRSLARGVWLSLCWFVRLLP